MLPMSQLVIPKSFDSCFTYEKQILWLKRKIEELEESGGGSSELDEIKARLDKVEGDLSTDEGKISNMQASMAELDEYCTYLEFYALNAQYVRNHNFGFKSRVGLLNAAQPHNPELFGMHDIDVIAVLDYATSIPWNNTVINTKRTMTGKLVVRGSSEISYTQDLYVKWFSCIDIPRLDVVGNGVNIRIKNYNAYAVFARVYGIKNGEKTLIGEDNETFSVASQTDTYNGESYEVLRFTNNYGPTLELDHHGSTYDKFSVEFTVTVPFVAYKDTTFNKYALSWQPNNNSTNN